jgi:hypothetical protein
MVPNIYPTDEEVAKFEKLLQGTHMLCFRTQDGARRTLTRLCRLYWMMNDELQRADLQKELSRPR